MEGGADRSATGVEYRAVVTHEGSNPSLSAQWRQQRVLHGACKALAFGMVSSSLTASTRGFSPTYLLSSVRWPRPETPTSPPSSADRASGSGPEGAWFKSTGGHASKPRWSSGSGYRILNPGVWVRSPYAVRQREAYEEAVHSIAPSVDTSRASLMLGSHLNNCLVVELATR